MLSKQEKYRLHRAWVERCPENRKRYNKSKLKWYHKNRDIISIKRRKFK